MDDLASLELLSLVSKVTSEIQNHLGISEKTLAEFVIDQHLKCSSLPEFKQTLEAMGADFPQSLVESIDHLILTMHPKYKNKKLQNGSSNGTHNVEKDLTDIERKARVFKGLSVPDKAPAWEEENEPDHRPTEKHAKLEAVDDTFAMLEGLAGKAKSSSRKRSISPIDNEHDRGRRRLDRYRSRSPSRNRGHR